MSKKIIEIRKNSYSDSVTLMSLSADIKKTEGIIEAVISIATAMNKELLEKVGLSNDAVKECSENDLVIAFECEDVVERTDIVTLIDEKLKGSDEEQSEQQVSYKTIKNAKQNNKDANMTVISVPGEYAAREAMIALKLGMNVMLFSDNVTIEDERRLKEYAHENELMVMGPDCGTAYINETALCFANKIKNGTIGIVGASGTGMQEIMVLIYKYGAGISNAIGVGGRDLTEHIGGIMLIDGLRMLQADTRTKTIVIVSKVPVESVHKHIMKVIEDEISKPVVICYTTDKIMENQKNAVFAVSLKDAAEKAVAIDNDMGIAIQEEVYKSKKTVSSKYIRGLYCGGTLCSEAYYYVRNRFENVHSNVSRYSEEQLEDVFTSQGHTLLDLGDDIFTNGRPHPMIDPIVRLDRILEESRKKETGVILLDFELGYGSHDDPVGATIDTIREAISQAASINNDIKFVAYVCGTDADYQNKKEQEKYLREAGCIVAKSNIDAVKEACRLI